MAEGVASASLRPGERAWQNRSMSTSLQEQFRQRAGSADSLTAEGVSKFVDAILSGAAEAGASDVHLVPTENGLRMSWRIDGVLQPVAVFPRKFAPNFVARLKVLAELLTYRTDVPQEGRIRQGTADLEMRLSTFPTLFGEQAVVRLFVGSGRYRHLDDLGLPDQVTGTIKDLLLESGGLIVFCGPAGSGKTTTAYACLRQIVAASSSERSIVTLEDPVEAVIESVSQAQANPNAGFDYERGLKSLLRQDPEVIMVGEIRDKQTAEIVFQASLTGHLVITTFHAGSAGSAISRLSDMGIEPYVLRSGILAVVAQRLVRRLCSCAVATDDRLGLDVASARAPRGCAECRGTGYAGRAVLGEILVPDRSNVGHAILSRSDADEIERLAAAAGMCTRWDCAREAVERGVTSPAEVRRVLGFS